MEQDLIYSKYQRVKENYQETYYFQNSKESALKEFENERKLIETEGSYSHLQVFIFIYLSSMFLIYIFVDFLSFFPSSYSFLVCLALDSNSSATLIHRMPDMDVKKSQDGHSKQVRIILILYILFFYSS